MINVNHPSSKVEVGPAPTPRAHTCGAASPAAPFLLRNSRLVSADMLELLAYLQDPELVARFQRRCGLVLVEAARPSQEETRAPSGTTVYADKARGQIQRRLEKQDNNSNYKHRENGCAAAAVSDVVYRWRWALLGYRCFSSNHTSPFKVQTHSRFGVYYANRTVTGFSSLSGRQIRIVFTFLPVCSGENLLPKAALSSS